MIMKLAAKTLGFFTGSWKWLAAITAIAGVLYGYGFHQGSTSELRKVNEDQEKRYAKALGTLESFHGEAIGIMRDVAATNQELNTNVAKIQRPTVSTCELPPEWLRAVAAGVRAANRAGASARADSAID